MNTTFRRWVDKVFFLLAIYLLLIGSTQNSCGAIATEVKKLSENTVNVGVAAQKSRDIWVEEEHRLYKEIDDLEHRLERIEWQRQKLRIYYQGLEKKIVALREKAEAMEAVNLELLPILEKNIVKLKEALSGDIPSNMANRRKSILQAQIVLNDYDMGLLNKTRTVLDAAAREVDLGHRVAVREDEIEIDGTGRRVSVLQLGRVGLYAMTLDSEKAYQWNSGESKWVAMENDVTAVHEAIEMAEGIRLVGFSELPVEPPVVRDLLEVK